jgi:hypothetical protein
MGSKETFFSAQLIDYITIIFKKYYYQNIDIKEGDFSSFFGPQIFYTLLPGENKRLDDGNIFDLYRYQIGLGELESYVLAKDYLYERRTFN